MDFQQETLNNRKIVSESREKFTPISPVILDVSHVGVGAD
jgi:hypothetical protein